MARAELSKLNRNLYLMARNFLGPKGEPGVPTGRNLFFGSAGTLPGIRSALDEVESDKAPSAAAADIDVLRQRVEALEGINQRLGEALK